MKKHDRALKRKGFRQRSSATDETITTVSTLKDSKGKPAMKKDKSGNLQSMTITRHWVKR